MEVFTRAVGMYMLKKKKKENNSLGEPGTTTSDKIQHKKFSCFGGNPLTLNKNQFVTYHDYDRGRFVLPVRKRCKPSFKPRWAYYGVADSECNQVSVRLRTQWMLLQMQLAQLQPHRRRSTCVYENERTCLRHMEGAYCSLQGGHPNTLPFFSSPFFFGRLQSRSNRNPTTSRRRATTAFFRWALNLVIWSLVIVTIFSWAINILVCRCRGSIGHLSVSPMWKYACHDGTENINNDVRGEFVGISNGMHGFR